MDGIRPLDVTVTVPAYDRAAAGVGLLLVVVVALAVKPLLAGQPLWLVAVAAGVQLGVIWLAVQAAGSWLMRRVIEAAGIATLDALDREDGAL